MSWPDFQRRIQRNKLLACCTPSWLEELPELSTPTIDVEYRIEIGVNVH